MPEYDKLSQLGQHTPIPDHPDKATLEVIDNPHADLDYCIRFTCPEFTSLCPKTGQPDFARLTLDYIPQSTIVESKSLKLFLSSFRNHGAFHEDCTMYIAKRLIEILSPKWLRITGIWYPRGGIPIDIFYQTTKPPADVCIPEMPISPYHGR